ncbi:LysR substrate-binding domain-containing protein [Komagataeibacter rhaeticus]|uniref:LysR substrate-binding domain-containing protein n=1 Tax=Komagataeibacter rhaeticus TaxID=215221 RepID=UPI0039E9CBD4
MAENLPTFSILRAFEAIGRFGGVRRAANYLRMDHTVISKHLRSLEKTVGTELYDRTLNTLTPIGREYHHKISQAFLIIQNATMDIQKAQKQQLSVWCAPALAYTWLGQRLSEFQARYPHISFFLKPTDGSADFNFDTADVDIRYIRDDAKVQLPSTIRWFELDRPFMFPVASPSYLQDRQNDIHFTKDILNLSLLMEENGYMWKQWFLAQGINADDTLKGTYMWHAHVALSAARSGNGVALTSLHLVREDITQGSLLQVRPTIEHNKPARMGNYVFFISVRKWQNPVLKDFFNWLKSRMTDDIQAFPHLFLPTIPCQE